MRVGIYARVSTKDQSCELQLRDLRAYCAARQLVVTHEYVDEGVRAEANGRILDACRKAKWKFRFTKCTDCSAGAFGEPLTCGRFCKRRGGQEWVDFLTRYNDPRPSVLESICPLYRAQLN